MTKKKPTHIIHFHDGTMEGDCMEASLPVTDPSITFREAKKQLATVEGMVRNWCVCDDPEEQAAVLEEFTDCCNSLVGAWIVDADTEKKFNKAAKYQEDAGGDSAAYAMQAAWKGMYKAFAVKEIGKKAK